MAREKLEEHFWALRKARKSEVTELSGVTKERIRRVLGVIGKAMSNDIVDAVFALLDDQLPSQFSRLKTGLFRDGATTAHVGCHVGILQRGKGKLDREGRDYWIKPLRELGAIEPVTLEGEEFVPGHIKAKSPNSAYRLAKDFVNILRSSERNVDARTRAWAAADAVRDRLAHQQRAAAEARKKFSNEHTRLIEAVQHDYAPHFLPEFDCVYVDSDDGDRVTADEKAKLAEVGIALNPSDPFPDLMFFDRKSMRLWCIEAVTSDGEVDEHKVRGVRRLCEQSGCELAGLTTAYLSRKDWLRRQKQHQNLAMNTFIWTADDPRVQYKLVGGPL